MARHGRTTRATSQSAWRKRRIASINPGFGIDDRTKIAGEINGVNWSDNGPIKPSQQPAYKKIERHYLKKKLTPPTTLLHAVRLGSQGMRFTGDFKHKLLDLRIDPDTCDLPDQTGCRLLTDQEVSARRAQISKTFIDESDIDYNSDDATRLPTPYPPTLGTAGPSTADTPDTSMNIDTPGPNQLSLGGPCTSASDAPTGVRRVTPILPPFVPGMPRHRSAVFSATGSSLDQFQTPAQTAAPSPAQTSVKEAASMPAIGASTSLPALPTPAPLLAPTSSKNGKAIDLQSLPPVNDTFKLGVELSDLKYHLTKLTLKNRLLKERNAGLEQVVQDQGRRLTAQEGQLSELQQVVKDQESRFKAQERRLNNLECPLYEARDHKDAHQQLNREMSEMQDEWHRFKENHRDIAKYHADSGLRAVLAESFSRLDRIDHNQKELMGLVGAFNEMRARMFTLHCRVSGVDGNLYKFADPEPQIGSLAYKSLPPLNSKKYLEEFPEKWDKPGTIHPPNRFQLLDDPAASTPVQYAGPAPVTASTSAEDALPAQATTSTSAVEQQEGASTSATGASADVRMQDDEPSVESGNSGSSSKHIFAKLRDIHLGGLFGKRH